MTCDEYKKLIAKSGGKYRNKKTIVNGIPFASKKESKRYVELKLLERAGRIQNLRLQVPYELIPKQKGERAVIYKADFVYEHDGKTVVEDAKGYRTQNYIIKRKLMKERYGIEILET